MLETVVETTDLAYPHELVQHPVVIETGLHFCNPVIDQDFPDPAVLQMDGVYYAYGTQAYGKNVQVARSTDLVHWEMLGDALPELPTWAMELKGCWTWSPVVARPASGNHFVLYYVTRYKFGRSGTMAIGIAIGDNPAGPFRSVGAEPFICQADEGGTIDPHVFIEDDGTRYLLWKNDGNSMRGVRTYLYLQRLSPDGLSLEGPRKQLLTTSEAWEGRLIEAPTLWKRDGKYYLFYSANCYADQRYAIGYAVADNLWGPYVKLTHEPLLRSNLVQGLLGPGGQDVVFGPQGDTWLIYHAWTGMPESVESHLNGKAQNCYRHVRVSRLVWQGDCPAVVSGGGAPQPMP